MRMPYFICILSLFSAVTLTAASQSSDSLLERGLACAESCPDSSLLLIKQYLDSIGTSIDIKDRDRAYYGLGLASFRLGQKKYRSSEYADALPFYTASAGYFEKSGNTSATAEAYLLLSDVYSALNQYKRAIDCANTCAELSIMGGDEDILSDAYTDLGKCYRNISEYRESIKYYEKAVKLCESSKRYIDEETTLVNMVRLYDEMTNTPKADHCLDRMRNILNLVPEEKRPRAEYYYYLSAAEHYFNAHRYEESDDNIKCWYDIKTRYNLGSPLSGYMVYMLRRVNNMQELGRYDEAVILLEEILSNPAVCKNDGFHSAAGARYAYCLGRAGRHGEAVNLMKKFLSEADSTAMSLYVPDLYRYLVDIYFEIHDYENGITCAEAGLDLFSDDENNVMTAQYIRNVLSNMYCEMGDYRQAWSVFSSFITVQKRQIREAFRIMTDQEREQYWYQTKPKLLDILRLASKCPEGHAGDVYDMALFTKGLLLNSKKTVGTIISESGDTVAAGMYLDKEKLLEKSAYAAQEGRYAEADSLKWAADDMDREIMTKVDYYGVVSRFLSDTYEDVREVLKKKDLAVEYITSTVDSADVYYAVLLRRAWKEPRFIRLCTQSRLDTLTGKHNIDMYYEGDTSSGLYSLLVAPVLKYASPGDRIHFSPSGILHLVNIAALPLPGGGIVADRYDMHRVSSTRELIRKHTFPDHNTASVFGGLKYSSEWKPLRYSDMEVNDINKILSSDGSLDVALYTGVRGNKSAFMDATSHTESIFHISTHGFFMNDSLSASIDPMRRCGLVMADAADGDDIIHGDEISGAALYGNKLVVLSACQSALGELTGDGIFGLQRAFKKAGAGSIVMSLWDVNDRIGAEFMNEFYSGIVKDNYTVEEAFSNSVIKIRHKYPEPYYWAGFILLD